MAIHPIRVLPDPVLREKAKRVPKVDASIHKLIEDMIDSMYEASGVGLAAPQIGVSLRVIVIGLPDEEPFALVNPEIVKVTGGRLTGLPDRMGRITRHNGHPRGLTDGDRIRQGPPRAAWNTRSTTSTESSISTTCRALTCSRRSAKKRPAAVDSALPGRVW